MFTQNFSKNSANTAHISYWCFKSQYIYGKMCAMYAVFHRINCSEHCFVYMYHNKTHESGIYHSSNVFQCLFFGLFVIFVLILCFFFVFSANNFQQDETKWNFWVHLYLFTGYWNMGRMPNFIEMAFWKKGLKMINWYKYATKSIFSLWNKTT